VGCAERLAGEAAGLAVCCWPWIKTPPGCWFFKTPVLFFCPGWAKPTPPSPSALAATGGSLPARWSLPLAPSFAVMRRPWPGRVSAQGQGSGGDRPSDLATPTTAKARSPWAWGSAAAGPLRPPLQACCSAVSVPDDSAAQEHVAGSASMRSLCRLSAVLTEHSNLDSVEGAHVPCPALNGGRPSP